MPDPRFNAERQRLEAEASKAHALAEKALREHAAEVQKARSYYDDAEEKQIISAAELESGRAAIDEAERELRATVSETLTNIDAQTKEAISALAGHGN
jgi:BMFP domain-containing protein YqiC